jgi:hypothetical protein
MTEPLTPEGYRQTKEKLADLERRLEAVERRTDLDPEHRASVRRSYKQMMRQYLEEMKLYESRHAPQVPTRKA